MYIQVCTPEFLVGEVALSWNPMEINSSNLFSKLEMNQL